jgi:hypothetical protein
MDDITYEFAVKCRTRLPRQASCLDFNYPRKKRRTLGKERAARRFSSPHRVSMFAAGQAQRGEKSSAAQFAAVGSQSLAQRSCAANLHATPMHDTRQIYFSKLHNSSTIVPQKIHRLFAINTELQLTAGQQERLFKSRGANNPAELLGDLLKRQLRIIR